MSRYRPLWKVMMCHCGVCAAAPAANHPSIMHRESSSFLLHTVFQAMPAHRHCLTYVTSSFPEFSLGLRLPYCKRELEILYNDIVLRASAYRPSLHSVIPLTCLGSIASSVQELPGRFAPTVGAYERLTL